MPRASSALIWSFFARPHWPSARVTENACAAGQNQHPIRSHGMDNRFWLSRVLALINASDAVDLSDDAVKSRFTQTPRQLRRQRTSLPAVSTIRVSLAYRPPLDWLGCLAY